MTPTEALTNLQNFGNISETGIIDKQTDKLTHTPEDVSWPISGRPVMV